MVEITEPKYKPGQSAYLVCAASNVATLNIEVKKLTVVSVGEYTPYYKWMYVAREHGRRKKEHHYLEQRNCFENEEEALKEAAKLMAMDREISESYFDYYEDKIVNPKTIDTEGKNLYKVKTSERIFYVNADSLAEAMQYTRSDEEAVSIKRIDKRQKVDTQRILEG
jgi:hypothetical protein